MVHEINPKGTLATDGRLRSGDVILKVNDLDFTSSSYSFKEAITALRSIPWSVSVIRLLVFREGVNHHQEGAAQEEQQLLSNETSTQQEQQQKHHHRNNQNLSKEINLLQQPSSSVTGNDISGDQSKQVPNKSSSSSVFLGNKSPSCSSRSATPFLEENHLDILEVDLNKKSGKGLGISLTSFLNECGVFVSQVMPGGIADSDGSLCPGDHILEANKRDLRQSSLAAAALILKVSLLDY